MFIKGLGLSQIFLVSSVVRHPVGEVQRGGGRWRGHLLAPGHGGGVADGGEGGDGGEHAGVPEVRHQGAVPAHAVPRDAAPHLVRGRVNHRVRVKEQLRASEGVKQKFRVKVRVRQSMRVKQKMRPSSWG